MTKRQLQQRYERALHDYREFCNAETLAELRSFCASYNVNPNQRKFEIVEQLARTLAARDFRHYAPNSAYAAERDANA